MRRFRLIPAAVLPLPFLFMLALAADGSQRVEDAHLEELYRTASLWQVGENREVVAEARRELIALGERGLLFVLGKLDTREGLELRAIEEVVEGSGKAAHSHLIELLQDERPNVRRNAASLLGKLGAVEAAPLLEGLLGDPEANRAAITALADMGSVDSAPRIALALEDEKEALRITAASALSRLKQPETVQPLIEALSDPLASVRYPVMLALSEIGRPAVKSLESLLLQSTDFRVRVSALQALARIGDPSSEEAVVNALSDSDWAVRAHAALALSSVGGSDAMETLKRALAFEPHPFARQKIEEAMERLEGKRESPGETWRP